MMSKRPNVILVLTDDQGYGDLGCTGNPVVQTPTIDTFYNEAIRLTDYHVGPTCAPTRAGLMTGHYANSTGVWHTVGGRSLLRQNEVTLAAALKEAGYRTGIFGKWHLGDEFPYRPMDRGFEETVVHGGGGISQTPDYWGNDYFDDTYYVNGEAKPFKGYCTDVFFDEALGFIDRHQDEPFFCYIACNAPHGPYNVDTAYSDKYKGKTHDYRGRFYGMITNIDDNFARLQEKLEELGMVDDTILMFMTDNGTSAGIHTDASGHVTDGYNAGLRGGKNSEYDGGHRVPFFLKWPKGGLLGGKDFDMLCANVDFMPTILSLCGINNEALSFHGSDISACLSGEASLDRTIVTDSQRVAYPVKWRKSAVMNNQYRLVNGRELYDINKDRGQRTDISDHHPEIVDELRGAYDQWWDIVSTQYDDLVPFILGEKSISLNAHDIRNEECHTAWNQKMIRQATRVSGYFEVDVETEGQYEFTLRRWPKSLDLAINKGIDFEDVQFEKDFIMEHDWDHYMGGEAINASYGSVECAGEIGLVPVAKDASEVKIQLNLKAGASKLKCDFLNENKDYVTAAYYVDVKKI